MASPSVKPLAVRVWDLPTRVFHWLLVVCVAGSLVSAQLGGEAMRWHFRFGYFALSLLLFRIFWGFMGGIHSRFSAIFRLRRGQVLSASPLAGGHSLQGWLSVLSMLAALLLQIASGLVSDDEIASAGPFTHMVSAALVESATYYHTQMGKLVVIFLISLHLLAILFYFAIRRQNLISAMISGDKKLSAPSTASVDSFPRRMLALLIFALIFLLLLFGLRYSS